MKTILRQKNLLTSFLVLASLLAFWEVAADQDWISAIFLPAPSKTWHALVELVREDRLLPALGWTLARFAFGLTIGAFAGGVLGLMMGWWPRVHKIFNPIIAATHPIPKIAVFPLFVIVFGLGEGSKFAVILLGAFFPMLITSLSGLRQIDRVYFEVGENYGARGFNVFRHVLFPGSLPSLLAGLRLAANGAFVISIAVEIIAANKGLGVLLWFGWQTLRVAEVYAVLVVVAVIGVAVNAALEGISKWITPWAGQ